MARLRNSAATCHCPIKICRFWPRHLHSYWTCPTLAGLSTTLAALSTACLSICKRTLSANKLHFRFGLCACVLCCAVLAGCAGCVLCWLCCVVLCCVMLCCSFAVLCWLCAVLCRLRAMLRWLWAVLVVCCVVLCCGVAVGCTVGWLCHRFPIKMLSKSIIFGVGASRLD